VTTRTNRIKLTGAIQLRVTAEEVAVCETLFEKGIKSIDIFRRGLEAYVKDVIDEEK